jgi:hypothetical protein
LDDRPLRSICLEAPPNELEIVATDSAPGKVPSEYDVQLQVRASMGAFRGSTWCFVESREMEQFSAAVGQLCTSFQGKARLASMSPGMFTLTLSPASSRGYVLVEVELAKLLRPRCALRAEFEVDLPSVAPLVEWARHPLPLPT